MKPSNALPQIVLLSGPPHAGISAVAEALCIRYDRMAHVDVAMLAGFIRMGRLRPWDRGPDGQAQRELLISLACSTATGFVMGGYGVVVQDIALPQDLRVYARLLSDPRLPVHAVNVLPDLEVVLAAEREHPTEWGHGETARLRNLHAAFAAMPGVAKLDPASRTPEETADAVMELAATGDALLVLEADAEIEGN